MATISSHLLNSVDGTHANGVKVTIYQINPFGEKDWLVIDGGNTHFWSEIAINIAGSKGKK